MRPRRVIYSKGYPLARAGGIRAPLVFGCRQRVDCGVMKVGSVLGHYHVVRTLGRGGMGAVYEANDTRLNRHVALKVLPAKMANNPEWFKRFEREAQAVAAINHPNIVTIHSVEEADDVHFIILELVGGKTLDDLIPEGGLPIGTFFDVAIPLADAIAAAHKRGIAHRDLKPSNVMVDEEGRVKVLDFGIAKLVDDAPDDEAATQVGSEALTEEGKIVGTVAYMSPEQAEGKASDHRSDIFSLGIMLYEMATGDRPFVGDTKLSIMASIVKDEPTPIIERNMEMPRHLARIVKKALEKDLSRRYQSMIELRNDLTELKEEIDAGVPLITGESLTDPGGLEPYRAPAKGFVWGKWIGVGGVVVAIAAVGWAIFGPGTTVESTGPPAVSSAKLTTSGTDFGGTLSPDGEWFAFARQNGDGFQLHLQDARGRNPFSLEQSGVSPAFSPDGATIAFSRPWTSNADFTQGGGTWIMGRTGGDVRKLSDRGFNPAWSPDGRKIVFADEFVQANPYSRSAQGSRLRVIDVATAAISEPLEIRVPGLATPDAVQPNWSPNGHRIAYWAINAGQRDIWTIPAAGGDAVAVTDDEAVDFSPVWSRDGKWIYFASTRSGSMAIWRVAVDEETGEPSGEAQPITTGGLSEPGMLSFSEDGSKLLYTETLTRGSIVAGDFDPIALAFISSPTPIIRDSRQLMQANVSNDGARIVYRTGGARQDLFVANTDGSNEQQITNDIAKDWAPTWSPDDRRIAYYSNATGDYEVWTVNPDGSRPVRLTDLPGESTVRPVWSPDGSRISLNIREIRTLIVVADPELNFDDRDIQQVPLVDESNPASAFLVTGWRAEDPPMVGNYEGMYLFDPATGAYEKLLDVDPADSVWMADNRRILYRVPGEEGFFVIDSVTKEQWRIDTDGQEIVLSPDNQRAYMVRQDTESDIWVVEIGG